MSAVPRSFGCEAEGPLGDEVAPDQSPATVGRSWVVTAARAWRGYSSGSPGSNHNRRYDSIPAAASRERTSPSTVPRSSPTTNAPARMLSRATMSSSSRPSNRT